MFTQPLIGPVRERNPFRNAAIVVLLVLACASMGRAQTSSSNQLAITDAILSAHCVPAAPTAYGIPFQGPDGRTLTIQGLNFNNAASPLVTLGGQSLTVTAFTPTTITAGFDCGQFYTGSYRLTVSTGIGQPFNDSIIFSLSTQGPAGLGGVKGDKGDPGPQGANGLNGNDGKNGSNGSNGKDGQNGLGHRVVNTQLLPGQGGCANGGVELDFYNIASDGTATLSDTKIVCHGNNGSNGNNGANGKDGAPGQNGRDGAPGLNGGQGPQGPQGPAGVAKGYYKKFDSTNITSTNSSVLSQVVTGSPAYLIDAKVNSPFANNAKSVSCSLTALDNGVLTTVDTSDALLIGNTQVTAKGGISLAGVYSASSSTASVTISVSCTTGGDTRTLTNGRLNIVGANSLN